MTTKTRKHKEEHEEDIFFFFFRFVFSCFRGPGSVSHRALSQAESCAVVAAGLDLLAPVAVLDVPARGGGDAVLERVARRPSELAPDLARVDRVAAVVTGTIGHERLQ